MNQIEKCQTWELVPTLKDKNLIGSKWVFRNELNEEGQVIRNKERLVWQVYAQVEGVDFEETFSTVSKLESIRMFLAYAIHKAFKVYQMDIKYTFLNGDLKEELYIEQLEEFQLLEGKDYVCKLRKSLYGLKQDPIELYASLDKYLQQQGFNKGVVDNNIHIKINHGKMLIIEVYEGDIIFGSDYERLSQEIAKDMQQEFEMSMLGEMNLLLGLQIYQNNNGIYIYQSKYVSEMLKKFQMEDYRPVNTPMVTRCKLSKDDDSKEVDQNLYISMIGSLLYVKTYRLDVM